MSAGVTVYRNDFGSLVLNPRDIKSAENFAEIMQEIYWAAFGDEMIGVPEPDVFNNIVTIEYDERIQAEQAKIRWREYCQ